MRRLDAEIKQSPTPEAIAQLAELRIRQLNAFRELSHYNLTGQYLGLHPLVVGGEEIARLRRLRVDDPAAFLAEHARTQRNVTRYRRYTTDDSRAERRGRDTELLEQHEARAALFETIINE